MSAFCEKLCYNDGEKKVGVIMNEKIKINSYLKVTGESLCTLENQYRGRKEGNVLSYKEGDICVHITIFEDKVIMNRKTDAYEMELPFLLNEICTGKYEIPELEGSFDLKVETSLLKIKSGKIEVIYHLHLGGDEIGKYEFKLTYEVMT